MSEIKHVSFTQLSMYEKCGIQYEYAYDRGIRIPPKAAMVRGTAVHKQHERALKEKIGVGKLPPLAMLQQIASDSIDSSFQGAVLVEHGESLQRVRDGTKDEAVRLTALDHRELLPTLQPKAVEQVAVISIPGISRPLKVIIDCIEDRGVRDLKTSGKSPGQNDAEDSLQLSAYSVAHKAIYGRRPASVFLDNLVATQEPKLVTQEASRSDGDLQVFLNRLYRAVEGIEKGERRPAPHGSWWCSRNWCGYWNQCPYGGLGREKPSN